MKNKKDSNILVSILIPNYNGEKFINRTISSVFNQTYKNIEIIVADDASTDNSLKLLSAWQEIDPRIKVLKNEKNMGIGHQRNLLISKAKGQYFCFLDSDDHFNPKTVEWLLEPILKKNINYNLVCGKVWWEGITEKKGKVKWKMPFFVNTWMFRTKNDSVKYVHRNLGVVFHGVLFNRKFFDSLKIKFDENHIFEDVGSMLYVLLKAKTFFPVNNVCYIYIRRKNSLSSTNCNPFRKINDLIWQVDNLLKLLKDKNMLYNKKYKTAIMSWFCGIAYLIIVLESTAKKDDKQYEKDKLTWFRYKYSFLYLIFIKYDLEFYCRSSWWKMIILFFVKFGFSAEFKYLYKVKKNNKK